MSYACTKCGQDFDTKDRYNAHMARKIPCRQAKMPVININNISDETIDKVHYDAVIDADRLPDFNDSVMMTSALNDEFSAVISASRRAGKSYMLSYLYPKWQRIFDLVVVFSYSAHNTTYDFVTDLKFSDYNPEILKELFMFQKLTKNTYRFLIIFDDLVSTKVKHDDTIMQCYTRGRNSNISVVVSTQIFKLINKNNRGNTDYMFIGKTNTTENRMTLCETILMNNVKVPKELKSKTAKIEYLDEWLLRKTEDHYFIVIDMKSDSEKIYRYKTPTH